MKLRGFPEHLKFRQLQLTAYWCEMCGCIFLPQYEDDGVYPDRFQIGNPADSVYPIDGCEEDCTCHDLPGFIPDHAKITLNEDIPDED